MKERNVLIVVIFIFNLFICFGCKKTGNDTLFRNLKEKEYLDYESSIISKKPYHEMTTVNINNGKKKRKIISMQGHVISSYKETSDKAKWMILELSTWNDPMSKDATELWYIDGRRGIYKKLISSTAFVFMPDISGKYLLIEDLWHDYIDNNTPSVTIYEIPEMKKIKEIRYDKFSNTSLYVQELSYKDGFFYFTLENDGNLYSDEKIDISAFINSKK